MPGQLGKSNPSLFIKGGTAKEGKKKTPEVLTLNKYMAQRGSMPGVTMVAGCRQ
jgi:hypothetical protein